MEAKHSKELKSGLNCTEGNIIARRDNEDRGEEGLTLLLRDNTEYK